MIFRKGKGPAGEREESGAGMPRLNVVTSPHIATRESSRSLMLDVLVALMPALIFSGCYFFGPRALVLTGISVAGCVFFEALFRLIARRGQTVGDLSAVVTGVLLAFTLPADTPYWIVLVGDFFAIVIVKQLFGGLGRNFLNPALAGRIFLFSFPAVLSHFPMVRQWPALAGEVDAVSAATPMAALHRGELPAVTLQEMFTGVRGGSLGEVSAALLLLGGAYLVIRGVIRLRIPVCFLGTVAVLSWLSPPEGIAPLTWTLYSLMGGGVLLGAIFMATDYVTSPVTRWGQVVYGVGCGALTVFLRTYGPYPEGVAFAILMMNCCTWAIDKWCVPRPRRGAGRKGGEA